MVEKFCKVCNEKFDADTAWKTTCRRCYAKAMEAKEQKAGVPPPAHISTNQQDTAWRIARSTALAQAVQVIIAVNEPISIGNLLALSDVLSQYIFNGTKIPADSNVVIVEKVEA